MEINPVFRRESRVRWRGNRAFLLLFALAATLGLVMAYHYWASDIGGQEITSSAQLSQSGHYVFKDLSLTQMGAWLLIVPGLAAPSLAFERERGLLESLQLSGLAPWRVALGKFAGVMLFALLLLAVSAPPLALCFMIGGVAPAEFIGVLKLQITLIFFCAALGLYFSARARRPQEALRNTFVTLVLFLLVTTIGTTALTSLIMFFYTARFGFTPASGFGSGYLGSFTEVDALSPFWLMNLILDSNASRAVDLNQSLTLYWAISGLLLFLATHYAGRTLPDAQWQQRRRYLTIRRGRLTLAKTDGWSAVTAPSSSSRKASHENDKPAVWDVPLTSFIHFANPVLQREVRGLLRLRRLPFLLTMLLWMAAGLTLVGYAWALMWMLGFPEATFDVFQPCAWLAMIVVMLASPLRGAYAIVRERENGTWENLRLSLLEPRAILRGKAFAPLVLLSGVLLVTAPLWFAGIVSSFDGAYRSRGTLSLGLVVGTLALLYSTTFLYNAWGLLCSWRSRSSSTAMGWTISSLLIANLMAYPLLSLARLIDSSISYYFYGTAGYSQLGGISNLASGAVRMLNPWNELTLLLQINSNYYGYSSYSGYHAFLPPSLHIFMAVCLYFFLGWLLLWYLEWCMKRAQNLERESAPRVTLDEHLKNLLQAPRG